MNALPSSGVSFLSKNWAHRVSRTVSALTIFALVSGTIPSGIAFADTTAALLPQTEGTVSGWTGSVTNTPNDYNRNGVWGEESSLGGWNIFATPMDNIAEEGITLATSTGARSAKQVTTDSESGLYSFSFAPTENGWWRITEEQRAGWTQVTPSSPAYFDVFVTSNQVYSPYNFGNWQNPSITVTKWQDTDNDGIRDWNDSTESGTVGVKDEGESFTEPGVANWPFFIAEQYEGEEGIVYLHIVASGLTNASGTATIYVPETGYFFVLEGKQSGWNRTYPTGTGVFGSSTVVTTFENGVTVPTGFTIDTGTYFGVSLSNPGQLVTMGHPAGIEEPITMISFSNYPVPVILPTPTPTSGGGGNGPITGTFGVSNGSGIPSGQVLGTSTSTQPDFGPACERYVTDFLGPRRTNNPEQVRRLQTVLRDFKKMDIDITGVYDTKTTAAVKAFQEKYRSQILAPWGLSSGTGFVYLTTQKKINEIYCKNTAQFSLSSDEQKIIDSFRNQNKTLRPPLGNGNAPQQDGVEGQPSDTSSSTGGIVPPSNDSNSGTGLWSKIKNWFGGPN